MPAIAWPRRRSSRVIYTPSSSGDRRSGFLVSAIAEPLDDRRLRHCGRVRLYLLHRERVRAAVKLRPASDGRGTSRTE